MQSELKKKDLTGLPQTPFENTFRLVMANEKHKEIGSPKTTSDLEGKSQDLRITGFPECKQRVDCLLGIEKDVRAQVQEVRREPAAVRRAGQRLVRRPVRVHHRR